MSKLKIWNEQEWDEAAAQAAKTHPLRGLKNLPKMPGIAESSVRKLRFKGLFYLLAQAKGRRLWPHILRHPLRYSWRLVTSLFRKSTYLRDDDFFLYGLKSVEQFQKQLLDPKTLLVVGFSYCQKPHECPSKRFTADCIRDRTHPVCQQCSIGKVLHALPDENVLPVIIPTVHDIGEHIFKTVAAYPKRKILFLITACEMTLEMFGDWGYAVGVSGIGVRLDGRICNTMKAFELSEEGIKPGLTVVRDQTQRRILELVRLFSDLR